MKNKKPFAPWLPAPYNRMTRHELDAESDQYDSEFAATSAKRIPPAKPHPKKRGRPRKSPGDKSARLLVTMPPKLLTATDAAAAHQGLTRAALIRHALSDYLARNPRPRKSA